MLSGEQELSWIKKPAASAETEIHRRGKEKRGRNFTMQKKHLHAEFLI